MNKKRKDRAEEFTTIDVASLINENALNDIKAENTTAPKKSSSSDKTKNQSPSLITPEKENEVFDKIDKVLRKFIALFISAKKDEAMTIDFKGIRAKVNSNTISIIGKKNKIKLSYTLGQRKVMVNNDKPLHPSQIGIFLAWVSDINDDIANQSNIGTYKKEKRS